MSLPRTVAMLPRRLMSSPPSGSASTLSPAVTIQPDMVEAKRRANEEVRHRDTNQGTYNGADKGSHMVTATKRTHNEKYLGVENEGIV